MYCSYSLSQPVSARGSRGQLSHILKIIILLSATPSPPCLRPGDALVHISYWITWHNFSKPVNKRYAHRIYLVFFKYLSVTSGLIVYTRVTAVRISLLYLIIWIFFITYHIFFLITGRTHFPLFYIFILVMSGLFGRQKTVENTTLECSRNMKNECIKLVVSFISIIKYNFLI